MPFHTRKMRQQSYFKFSVFSSQQIMARTIQFEIKLFRVTKVQSLSLNLKELSKQRTVCILSMIPNFLFHQREIKKINAV